MPCKVGFHASNKPYSGELFFKLCEDHGVPRDTMRYHNKKFFGTQQHGGWSDYIGPNCMTN